MFAGAADSNIGANNARPRWLAASMSWRPLTTNAAAPVIASIIHCTLGRTGRRAGNALNHPLNARAGVRRGGAAPPPGGPAPRGASQVEKMSPLGLIQMER